jgi:hypothetical protein
MKHPYYSLLVLGLFLLLIGQDEIGVSRIVQNTSALNYKRFCRTHSGSFDPSVCAGRSPADKLHSPANFIDFTVGFAHSGLSINSYEYACIHGTAPVLAGAYGADESSQCWLDRQVSDKVLDLMMNWPIRKPIRPEKILGRFVNPLQKPICTCAFCDGSHLGFDMCAPLKTPIVAVASGRVIYAGFFQSYDGYGKIVLIDHGQGILSLYGHIEPLKRFEAKKALRAPLFVNAGEQIGCIGPPHAGEATSGPHLHFELLSIWKEDGRMKGALLNPANYLPAFKNENHDSSGTGKVRALYRKPWLNADLGRGSYSLLQTLRGRYPDVEINIPLRKEPLVKLIPASHTVKKSHPRQGSAKNRIVHQMFCAASHQHPNPVQALIMAQYGWTYEPPVFPNHSLPRTTILMPGYYSSPR